MSDPVRAFLGLGSNMGDRMALLRSAVASIPDVVKVSPVYETDPVGGPPGQDPYLNVVVELATRLSPRELLELAHSLEVLAGRVWRDILVRQTLDDVLFVVGH